MVQMSLKLYLLTHPYSFVVLITILLVLLVLLHYSPECLPRKLSYLLSHMAIELCNTRAVPPRVKA
jgi:hypothetical protein